MDADAGVARAVLRTGVTLPYVSVGPRSAVPVLLMHAWGESRRSFDRLLPALDDSVQAVAFDLRGHGEADKPPSGYRLIDVADDVVAFMDAVGLASAVLLGSSSGGYVAQQVAVANPDRVSALVLVGSPRSLQGRPPFADAVDGLSDPVDAAWVRQSLTWFPRFHAVPEWYVEDRVRDGVRVPAHVWREALRGLCDAQPPTDTGTIGCPALVIRGDRDELLAPHEQERLAAAITDARLLAYDGTGHLVLWEQPEQVAQDLTHFVHLLPRGTDRLSRSREGR
jgi:rifampin ADP-ribosylating transferase